MKITAYHATNSKPSILGDGLVRPMRLPNVYLFADRSDAESYCCAFLHEWIVTVEIDSSQIKSRWKPQYAPGGVIKLKFGENAKVSEVQF